MSGNQRWRQRKSLFRRPDEQIRKGDYEVCELPDDRLAKPFVVLHHYSASYPAARFRFGLFDRAGLVGVAVFSHPCNDRVLTNVFAGRASDSVELGRFVLLDSVPGNGETFFLGQCFRPLRRLGLAGVLSHCDPEPRTDAKGGVVFPGHLGTIYRAHNGRQLGKTRPRTLRLLPDGSVLSERALSKIRRRERGWRHAADVLVRHGASSPPFDLTSWLRLWLPRLTRTSRHGGCLRFAWHFEKGTRCTRS